MLSIAQAQQIVAQKIDELHLESKPTELYEPIRYILNVGGKRLRPSLTLLACDMFSGASERALPAALALEIFHNFTLLHDDIMDNAAVRRGKATVHVRWNNNVAILSGDAMCIKAYDMLSGCEPAKLPEVLRVFNQTALKVCEGQQFDMNFETTEHVPVDAYIEMIGLKTSVLLAACLNIGAILGNASEADALLMYNCGMNMGLAFQLQDDWLDVFGNEQTFGKEIGKDIVANKKTFLLINALHKAENADKEALLRWISATSFDANEKISAVKSIYSTCGIDTLTQHAIDGYLNEALQSLERVSVAPDRKAELQKFLLSLNNRRT